MAEAIQFSGTITPDVFWKAQKLHSRRRLAVFGVISVALILLGVLTWGREDSNANTFIFIACGVTIPVAMLLRRMRAKWVYKKSPYLKKSYRGTISPEAYSIETDGGSARVPWTQFIKATSSDDVLLLYRGPHIFNIICRESFNSTEDWLKARSMALELIE